MAHPPPTDVDADVQHALAREDALHLATALLPRLAHAVRVLQAPESPAERVQEATHLVTALYAAQLPKCRPDRFKLYRLLVIIDLSARHPAAFGRRSAVDTFRRFRDRAGLSHTPDPDPAMLAEVLAGWCGSTGARKRWGLVTEIANRMTGVNRDPGTVKAFWSSFARHYEKHGLHRSWGVPLASR